MSNELKLPCDVSEVSDGYHTFNELYEHRVVLFMVLMSKMHPGNVWKSKKHSDGSSFEGWFIAGMFKGHGLQITYHIPEQYFTLCPGEDLELAPQFDGHTSGDVLERLKGLLE